MKNEQQGLLRACKAGNEEKWNLLFAKYHPIARSLVRKKLRRLDKQTVDFIAQDVMLALHDKIQNINDMEHLNFFIRAVAHNKCVDYIRRNKLTTLPIEDDFPGVEEKVFLTDEEVERIIGLLKEEMEASIYTSDMEKKMPEIYHKIDDAATPLMEEILKDLDQDEYGPEDPMFRVWVPEELIDRAGLDPLFC